VEVRPEKTFHEIGGGTFGMDEPVPEPDVKYPATPGPADNNLHTCTGSWPFCIDKLKSSL